VPDDHCGIVCLLPLFEKSRLAHLLGISFIDVWWLICFDLLLDLLKGSRSRVDNPIRGMNRHVRCSPRNKAGKKFDKISFEKSYGFIREPPNRVTPTTSPAVSIPPGRAGSARGDSSATHAHGPLFAHLAKKTALRGFSVRVDGLDRCIDG